jgi:ABC-type nickel/cobalt efflux system permease component RcnA
VTLYFSEYIVPERMYPYMGIASGLIIIGMGLALLISRLRASNVHAQMLSLLPWIARNRALQSEAGALTLSQGPHDDGHDHHDGDGGHTHDNEHGHEHGTARDHHEAAGKHSHGFGPAHSHAIPGQDGEPVTVRRLIGLGIFGGMLPCPSAIVVMLSAISLHKVGFGLLLIVFFSLGLGGVLTAIGFAMVYGRAIAERVPAARAAGDRFTSTGAGAFAVRVFPAASAFIVVCAGVLVTLNAASGL